jgi:potassium-transporting ATPase KdpC subunit
MKGDPMKTILIALRLLMIMTVLTGLLYPLLVAGISRTAFPWKSSGSIIMKDGKAAGAALIAQKFESRRYFRPRPSASDYGAVPSGASNLGATSADLKTLFENRRKYWTDCLKRYAMEPAGYIPADLLFASGSGLDPHISPESARFQAVIVAAERNFSAKQVRGLHELIAKHTESPILGFMGRPRVNVLLLNYDLDRMK